MRRRSADSEAVPERDRLLSVQIGLIVAAVFLSPLVAAGLSHSHVPEICMQVLILLAATLWFLRTRRQSWIEMPSRRLAMVTAAPIVVGLLSFIATVSLHSSLLAYISLICYVTVFLMVGSLKRYRTAVYGLIGALLFSAIAVGAIGLKEHMLTTIPDWRAFSTFFNPDFLAGFMAIIFPIALAWYLSETSFGISVVGALAVVLSLANLLMSGSRFGALAASGGVIVFVVLAFASRSVRRPQLVKAGIILAPCIVTAILLGGTLFNRVASVNAESHSGDFRIHTWEGVARMVRDHSLLGTGLGTFEVAYPKYAQVGWTRLAHNSYLQYAAEGGVLMPIALVVLIGMAVIPAVIGLRRRREAETTCPDWMPSRSLMVIGLLAGVAASLARNLIDSDWYVAAIGTTFWIVLGAAVALSDRESVEFPMPVWKRWSKIGTFGLIMLWLLSVLASQWYYAGGWALLGSGEREDALKAFRRAIRYDPLDADLHRKMGGVLRLISEDSGNDAYLGEAERELKRAAELEPTAPKTYYQLGKLYAGGFHDDERAVHAYKAALDRDPHALQVLTVLAETYENMGRPSDALGVYQRMAVQEDSVYERVRAIPEIVEPGYIFAREALGRNAECLGDRAEAVRQYRRALDRMIRYRRSVEDMGPVMEQMGSRDRDLEARIEALRTLVESRLIALGASFSSPP